MTARIVVNPNEVQLWGLTRREYVLAALEALAQADIAPSRFTEAFRRGRGKADHILWHLDLADHPTTCQDCGHPWAEHGTEANPGTGCQIGSDSACGCTRTKAETT